MRQGTRQQHATMAPCATTATASTPAPVNVGSVPRPNIFARSIGELEEAAAQHSREHRGVTHTAGERQWMWDEPIMAWEYGRWWFMEHFQLMEHGVMPAPGNAWVWVPNPPRVRSEWLRPAPDDRWSWSTGWMGGRWRWSSRFVSWVWIPIWRG